jgi:endonuclease YncB( thermonuclease family)
MRINGFNVFNGYHAFKSSIFRFFHVPTFRRIPFESFPGPTNNADQTIPVRLAGVDCPEAAHFGMTAQPFSFEAYEYTLKKLMPGCSMKNISKFSRGHPPASSSNWTKGFFSTWFHRPGDLITRQVRIEIYRQDQYNRVVAMVYYRPYPKWCPFYWRNLSLDLLRNGLGVVYTQGGAEYGNCLQQFTSAEQKAKYVV